MRENGCVSGAANALLDSVSQEIYMRVSRRDKHMFWFRLPPATKAPRGRPCPRRRAEENEKKQAETGGSG